MAHSASTLAAVAVALGCLLTLRAATGATVRVFGDRVTHPTSLSDFLRTYVDMPKDHDGDTPPVAVGVQLTPGFVAKINEMPPNVIATIPMGPDMPDFNYTAFEHPVSLFPQVGKNPFKFLFWTYIYNGHPPVGIWSRPHFDFHFMFEDPVEWWDAYSDTAHGPCQGVDPELFAKINMPIPESCFPSGSGMASLFDNIWGMGNHVTNVTSPDFMKNELFIWALLYGQFGGRVPYMEPMVTRELLMDPKLNICADISASLPKNFDTERYVPTELCLMAGSSNIKVEYRKFKMVPGGCADMLDGPMVAYLPEEVAATYPPECKAPMPP